MEFEFWWLLALPFFFGLGWLSARVDLKQLLKSHARLPAAYFKGLNCLISNQYDQAIDAFTEALQFDADSLELNFALGSLLRRSGALERAIHLHIRLLQNSQLTPQQTLAVKAELAQDYLKAGLLDRAEELFSAMTDAQYQQPALRALIEIYVREREWMRAINTAVELERLSGVSFRIEVSHYYCELAQQSILAHQVEQARLYLAEALRAYAKCARANILLGDLALSLGQHQAAIVVWRSIEFQAPAMLGLVSHRLLASYRVLKDFEGGVTLLSAYQNTYGLGLVREALYTTLCQEQDTARALTLARVALGKTPCLGALHEFLRALEKSALANEDTRLMQQTVHYVLSKQETNYACTLCGFKAKYHHWQCPACNAWEAFPPESSAV